MRLLLLTCVLCLAAVVFSSQDPAHSPIVGRIEAYFATLSSGDAAAVRQFISDNYAASALQERPVEQRMEGFGKIRETLGAVREWTVTAVEDDRTTVRIQATNPEELSLVFLHEPAEPYKLLGLLLQVGRGEGGPPRDRGPQTPLTEAAALDAIRSYAEKQAEADQFSGVVLVAREGQPLLHFAYGLADREKHVPVTPDTRFNIASIGKSFTKVALEKLRDEGRLDYKSRVGQILPDYPNAEVREKVTVEHLLHHTGGVPDIFGSEFVTADRQKIRTLQDYLPLFADKPLEFEPGSQEKYSNGGFIILGLIIERLSGQSYYDYVTETVFKPAGMNESDWPALDEETPLRAIGYTHRWNFEEADSPELRTNQTVTPGRGSSAGGGYSTALDLLKFVNAIETGRLKSSESGSMAIAGGAPGTNAAVEAGLPGGYTVIVLCNMDPPMATDTAQRFSQLLARVKN